MAAPRTSRAEGAPAGELLSTLTKFFAARLSSEGAAARRLCVALSGGRDSVVLLHALSALRAAGEGGAAGLGGVELSAIHVHHGISPHADHWAGFCADVAESCGVPLRLVRVQVPVASGEGLEGAARRLRHEAFAEQPAEWLALAHHRDDQAETVLLNLLRGAGVSGAAGMHAERPRATGPTLLRPLLDIPRAAIESYASAHALTWIEDESNGDTWFRRNYLRHEIMPRLNERFAGADRSLARAAGHFAEAAGLLEELAVLDRERVAAPSGRVALPAFNALPAARARNLLRHELLAAGFRAPDTRWIDEARSQLSTTSALSETCVATADGELRIYRGELYVVPHRPPAPSQALPCSLEAEFPWAGGRVRFLATVGEGISRQSVDAAGLRLQPRSGGESLQLQANRPRRSLRNLLQESGIPPWERERLPFLWSGERLLWIGGLGFDVALRCPPGEPGFQPVWELLPSHCPSVPRLSAN